MRHGFCHRNVFKSTFVVADEVTMEPPENWPTNIIDVCTCSSLSPVGCWVHGPQPREHTVPCRVCNTMTWNIDALCSVACWALAKWSPKAPRSDQ